MFPPSRVAAEKPAAVPATPAAAPEKPASTPDKTTAPVAAAPAQKAAAPPPPPSPSAAPDPAPAAFAAPAGPGYAVQVAALNVRTEADAIAKRLTSKGYAAYVLAPSAGTPKVFRVRVGKFPTRKEAETSRPSCRRKSSSSPGLRASARLGRPPGAQLPEIRISRLWLDCARAAARRAQRPRDPASWVLSRPRRRGRVLHGHAVLDHAGDGGLRRPADVGGRARQPRADLGSRALSGCVRPDRPAPDSGVRPDGACRCAARLGRHRARAYVRLHRLSVGAPGIQPGHGAAHRAARERGRRVRRVGARRGRQRGGGGDRHRPNGRGVAGGLSSQRPSWSLAIGGWGARRAAAAEWTRRAIRFASASCRATSTRRRNGTSPAPRRDLQRLPRDDAAGDCPGGRRSCCGPSRRRRSVSTTIPRAPSRSARIARQSHVSILFGSDQVEQGRPVKYYNSAFLVGDDGRTAGVYRKMHLVPFGEYVPFKRVFFFAAPLVEAVSDFSPGEEAVVLPVGAHRSARRSATRSSTRLWCAISC